jgi:glutamine phosphoribosylpyrophosphate amidotransferase
MCGIFGIIGHTPIDPALYVTLGQSNTQRGNLAFGGLVGVPAAMRVFRYADPFDASRVDLDGAQVILSHIRAPTGGQSRELAEVHPFETRDVLLAHNGLLLNHHDFPAWRIDSSLAVDSQVIAGGVQHHLDDGQAIETAIASTAGTLSGQQACWLWHKPTRQLYLWRVMSSLWIGRTANHAVFSSVRHESTPTLLDEGVIYHVDCSTLELEAVSQFDYYSPYKI